MIRSLHRTLAVVAPVALLLAAASRSLPAQDVARAGTIDPGMTRAQVEERLGAPKVVRTAGTTTYLFYANGCARTCGMDDLVVLEEGAVTDAVFRSSARRYSGQSSSPVALAPTAARAARPRGAAPDASRIRSDTVLNEAGRGGIVIGGPATPDSAAKPERRRAPRPARSRRASASSRLPASVPASTAPAVAPARDGTSGAAGAEPAAVPAPGVGDRTGRASTTGPVDARAGVKNAGAPLYPKATPVKTPSQPASDSATRVAPYQGAQLAPADSDFRTLRRPVTIPGQTGGPATRAPARPDSTRP